MPHPDFIPPKPVEQVVEVEDKTDLIPYTRFSRKMKPVTPRDKKHTENEPQLLSKEEEEKVILENEKARIEIKKLLEEK